MRHYILYHASTSETGKNILEQLQGMGIDIDGGTAADDEYGVMIRWGSQAKVPYKPRRVVNSLLGIKRSSDKLGALQALRESVNVPEVFTSFDPSQRYPVPLLGRKATHMGGTDIVLCLQASDIGRAIDQGCNHFVEYIPTAQEYRVHVYKGEVIKVSEKLLTDTGKYTRNWVRNYDNGFTFHNPHTRPRHHYVGMAIDAVELLGLDFGAVDLIVSDDNKSYVLEVNTAPGLTADSSLAIYVERFASEIASFEDKLANAA